MILDIATLTIGLVLKLALCGIKGVAQRHIGILVTMVGTGGSAHNDRRTAGQTQLDPNIEQIALLMAPVRRFDHDPATDQPVAEALELGGFLSDAGLDGLRGRHALEHDVEHSLHAGLLLGGNGGAASRAWS